MLVYNYLELDKSWFNPPKNDFALQQEKVDNSESYVRYRKEMAKTGKKPLSFSDWKSCNMVEVVKSDGYCYWEKYQNVKQQSMLKPMVIGITTLITILSFI